MFVCVEAKKRSFGEDGAWERNKKAGEREKEVLDPRDSTCQDFASSPAEGCLVYRVNACSHKTSFITTLQWVQKMETVGGGAIAERGALTDHTIAGENL